MPHFIEMKKALKVNILKAVDQAGKLDESKTVAEFSLSYGFTEKTIKLILRQMRELNYIIIENGVITRPEIKKWFANDKNKD